VALTEIGIPVWMLFANALNSLRHLPKVETRFVIAKSKEFLTWSWEKLIILFKYPNFHKRNKYAVD
jgi:hypothetical protein